MSLAQGTSESTPNAAGVAALILTAHPDWTREQVAAQLLGTCDNLDAENPEYVGMLGAGRVNSLRAVSEAVAPPTFRRLAVMPNDGTLEVDHLTVELASVFECMTYTRQWDQGLGRYRYAIDTLGSVDDPRNWQLVCDGNDNGSFDDGELTDPIIPLVLRYTEALYEGARNGYDVGMNQLDFGIDKPEWDNVLQPGLYRFTAYGTTSSEHPNPIEDPFGSVLDGDGSGVSGGDCLASPRTGVFLC